MRQLVKFIIGGALLALASSSALAHDDIGFGLSIAVPGASGYVVSPPAYYPPPVYVAPPAVYYDAPPATYYAPPATVYYEEPPQVYYSAPGVSIYYGPSYERNGDEHFWRRHGDDDDDD